MKQMYTVPRFISILVLSYFVWGPQIWAQSPLDVIIQPSYEHVYIGIENKIRIVAKQEKPVSPDQVRALFYSINGDSSEVQLEWKYNAFHYVPKKAGRLGITVTTDSGSRTQYFYLKPIEAVGRLSKFDGQGHTVIPAVEMKVQSGIMASVLNLGFDAQCKVEDFELIRVNEKGGSQKVSNIGARFVPHTLELTGKAQSGDLFIFRNIRYRCPGAVEPQYLPHMIFEIR
jgi:hypothetical protein